MATSSSIVTFEKPLSHVGLPDWKGRLTALQHTADTRRKDAFDLRHQARQMRNETKIRTEWDTYHNNVRLGDRCVFFSLLNCLLYIYIIYILRISEMDRWRDTLQMCLDRLNSEMSQLMEEKAATEREMETLCNTPLTVVSECLTMRDSKLGSEITYDDADTELKKVLNKSFYYRSNSLDDVIHYMKCTIMYFRNFVLLKITNVC